MVQRGRLAARNCVYWGNDADEIKQAEVHSFTLTNACPQSASFTGQNGDWCQMESLVIAGAKAEDLRVREFMWPSSRAVDRTYGSFQRPG